jgi:hypothetical protein
MFFNKARTVLSRVGDSASQQLVTELKEELSTLRRKHSSQVKMLEEELKLRDLQVKNLVAENQRNYERIKSETAHFSANISYTTGKGA